MLQFSPLFLLFVLFAGNPIAAFEVPPNEIGGHEEAFIADEPCALLSDDLLEAHFSIGNVEITRSPSKYSPHPLCIVTWPKPDAEAIEAENEANMMAYMTAKMQGNDKEASKLRKRTTNEVSLTINKDKYDSAEKASAGFDNAMRILREGMTITVRGKETKSPTYETDPVDGVGEKAMWVSGLNQLSVLSGRRIFHLGVIIDEDRSNHLEKAKAIAMDLCKLIR